MLITGCVQEISKLEKTCDEVWVIVRSPGKIKFSGKIKHVPELSPSMELFGKYRALVNDGTWNEQSFKNVYTPHFLQNMKSKESRRWLNKLYCESKQKNIAIVCFCKNENLCHRSIIKDLIDGANGKESKYFNTYKRKEVK